MIDLFCTDSLSDLEGVVAEGSVDLVVMDGPYASMNQHLSLGSGRIVGDGSEESWFREWSDDPDFVAYFMSQLRRTMKPDAHIYMMFDSMSLLKFGPCFQKIFDLKNIITWDKVAMGMGYNFRRRSEFILFGKMPGSKRPLTSKGIPDVWEIKRVHRPDYPTQKPVELFEMMIRSSLDSATPGLVLDPFMGSGSSAVAAQIMGHNYIGIDVNECAIGITRERLAGVVA